jgi:large subunit ribosomal protein L3
MSLGLIGQKVGMTRIFTDSGHSIPVSVVEVMSNSITQIKTTKSDGYNAVQIMYAAGTSKRKNKPLQGHCTKANLALGVRFREFRIAETDLENFVLGNEIKVNIFKQGQYIDIAGVSKGKGFSGVIKRHNFSSQDATHGNSLSHNVPGSIGQRQTPGKVFKGKKMAGQLGNHNCSVQNLEIIRIDSERNLILVKGAIPGAINGYVVIKPAEKKPLDDTSR